MKTIRTKLKKFYKYIVRKGLLSNRIRPRIDQENIRILKKGEVSWRILDRYYTVCRNASYNDVGYRYGIKRSSDVFTKAFNAFFEFVSIENVSYFEIGCGVHNPFAQSAIFYLNGADLTRAVDKDRIENLERSSVALFDLLIDCYVNPDAWHRSQIDREDYYARLALFDLNALKNGRLYEGISKCPLHHESSDILNCSISDNSVDIMTSRAFLEHVMVDFRSVLSRLYAMMKPGGVAFHEVDLRDHRWIKPGYNKWSFMTQNRQESHLGFNQLRSCEMRDSFDKAGFEILSWETEVEKMPEVLRGQLNDHYSRMSLDELSIIGIKLVVRKPGSSLAV
jgi:methyltransferase family protein